MKNRGVRDILIACRDNLSGLANAINTAFPKTESQLCIIYMIRNSTKYVSYKDLKAVMADLKKIYGGVSEDAALYALEEFREKWDGKYPQIYKNQRSITPQQNVQMRNHKHILGVCCANFIVFRQSA